MIFERSAPLKPPGMALLVFGLAAGWLATGPASAQEDTSTPDASVMEVVDVVLVNVEVWATDRKGNPIQGLSAADFEVFEDGRPVEILLIIDAREMGKEPGAL